MHPELVPPEPTINPKQQQLLTSVFTPIQVPASNIKDALSQQKWVLARQLALMCCKDLTPFEVVEKEGFRQFLIQRNAIPSTDLLPCARTLARSALNTVYDETKAHVIAAIATSSNVVAVTTDMWTDNYRRRSYMTATLHFVSPDFEIHDLVLRTSVFDGIHSGENIKKEMTDMLKVFNMTDKTIIFVTDQGSNVVKACKLMNADRYGCVAHGVHNLIMVEGIRGCSQLSALLDKVKDIVKLFTFKSNLLENEAIEMSQERMLAELEDMHSQFESQDGISVAVDDSDYDDESENAGYEHQQRSSNSMLYSSFIAALLFTCRSEGCILIQISVLNLFE